MEVAETPKALIRPPTSPDEVGPLRALPYHLTPPSLHWVPRSLGLSFQERPGLSFCYRPSRFTILWSRVNTNIANKWQNTLFCIFCIFCIFLLERSSILIYLPNYESDFHRRTHSGSCLLGRGKFSPRNDSHDGRSPHDGNEAFGRSRQSLFRISG